MGMPTEEASREAVSWKSELGGDGQKIPGTEEGPRGTELRLPKLARVLWAGNPENTRDSSRGTSQATVRCILLSPCRGQEASSGSLPGAQRKQHPRLPRSPRASPFPAPGLGGCTSLCVLLPRAQPLNATPKTQGGSDPPLTLCQEPGAPRSIGSWAELKVALCCFAQLGFVSRGASLVPSSKIQNAKLQMSK